MIGLLRLLCGALIELLRSSARREAEILGKQVTLVSRFPTKARLFVISAVEAITRRVATPHIGSQSSGFFLWRRRLPGIALRSGARWPRQLTFPFEGIKGAAKVLDLRDSPV